MTTIFYLFAVLPMFYEIFKIQSPNRFIQFQKSFKERKSTDFTPMQTVVMCFNLMYILWIIFGLITFQWILFALMLIIYFILIKHKYWIVFDAFISLCLMIEIWMNHFHFHIDLYSYIKHYIMQ